MPNSTADKLQDDLILAIQQQLQAEFQPVGVLIDAEFRILEFVGDPRFYGYDLQSGADLRESMPELHGLGSEDVIRLPTVLTPKGPAVLMKVVACSDGKRQVFLFDHSQATAELTYIQQSSNEHFLLKERYANLAKHLEEQNVELAQFSRTAAHDMRDPLRVANNYLGLIQLRYGDALDERGNQMIHRASAALERLLVMIDELLSLSQLGTTSIQGENAPADTALDNALAGLETLIEENQACVTREPLPVVHCDIPMLTRLFQNLIANGIKYQHQEASPTVHVAAKLHGNQWLFSVKDNGIGIAKKYHEVIFHSFERLHSHDDYPGTGIGLAACKRICDLHQGKIWVESSPGKGSTFWFTMPKPKEAEIAA